MNVRKRRKKWIRQWSSSWRNRICELQDSSTRRRARLKTIVNISRWLKEAWPAATVLQLCQRNGSRPCCGEFSWPAFNDWDTLCELLTLHILFRFYIMANTSSHGIMNITWLWIVFRKSLSKSEFFIITKTCSCQDDFVIFVSSRIMRQSILNFTFTLSPCNCNLIHPGLSSRSWECSKKEPSCIFAWASCNRLYECESVHHELTNNQSAQFPKWIIC